MADGARIEQIANAARAASGDRVRAVALWRQLLEIRPDHAEALNAVANWHLVQGEAQAAIPLLERAVAAVPDQPVLLFNLATGLGGAGRLLDALETLDRVLALDPYFVQALFRKGLLLDQVDRPSEAAAIFRNYLACMSGDLRADPRMADMVARAQASIDADNRRLGVLLREAAGGDGMSPRVAETVRLLTGEAKRYIQEPTFLLVPQLPAIPYFDPERLPWLAELEAASETILIELLRLLDGDEEWFEPYIALPDGAPVNQWGELNNNRRWSAYHFWLNGVRQEAQCARCPQTAALIENLPRISVRDRAPNAFFSVLRAGARIPPHTGVTNLRATIHLGLIVPPDCRFRVGDETRVWEAGKAWAFDDSIEHEAWNGSGEDRIILILDGWNPYIEPSEREGLIALHAAYDRHYGRAPGWADGA